MFLKQKFPSSAGSAQVAEPKMETWRGILLWFTLFSAYLVFLLVWVIATPLNKDILKTFFPDGNAPPTIVNQAVNWGITIGRSIGSILIGWLIAKFTHKYASIIALVISLASIPSAWVGNYWGFIALRTIFAIGATTLIVLLQPIIAGYFKPKQKAIASSLNSWSANIGTILALFLFLIPGVNETLKENWQTVITVASALMIIPLILYIIFGQKFDTFPSQVKKREEMIKKFGNEKYSIWTFVKNKETWKWGFSFGMWLTIAAIILFLNRHAMMNMAGFKTAYVYATGGKATAFSYFENISTLWTILFMAPVVFTPFTFAFWNKSGLRRKPFIYLILALGFLFFIFSGVAFMQAFTKPGNAALANIYKVASSSSDPNALENILKVNHGLGDNTGWYYFLGIVSGFFIWGSQGVILNMPHERPNINPRRAGYEFGFIWGLGYLFFTICNIILSFTVNRGPINDGYWAFFIVFFFMAVILILSVALLKETRPNGAIMPFKIPFLNKKKQ